MTPSNATVSNSPQFLKGGFAVAAAWVILQVSSFSQSADIFDEERVAEAPSETAT